MAKKNKKNTHSFWKRIRFKYRVSAFNENTLEEVWRMRASVFSGIVLFLFVAAVLITVTSVIIIKTPVRYYLPGYLDSEVRELAVRNTLKGDSLETELLAHHLYIDNVRKILDGTMEIDSVKSVSDTLMIPANDPSLQKSESEQRFVEQYAEEEKYNLSMLPYTTSQNDALIFFAPLRGSVTKKFDSMQKRYGVEIKSSGKSAVTAIADGSVFFSGYDVVDGYVIEIQHKNGYLSLYKNCSALLKSVGDVVRMGEAIGTLDMKQTGDKEESGVLLFELWHDSYPVDPEDYISFE